MAKNGLFILSDVEDEEATIDIVAVHGLNGHAFKTWTATKKDTEGTKSEVLWLRDFLPSLLPKARITTFGYDARIFGPSASTIEDDAKDLLHRLDAKRNGKKDMPIIFIAHSLGGLVVKQALIYGRNIPRFEDILNSTKGIMFMGTPHRGSKHASSAKIIIRMLRSCGAQTQRRKLTSLKEHSDDLERITELFCNLTENFNIVSFYETFDTPELRSKVVERESATMGIAGETCVPLAADHRAMCRFDSDGEDSPFQVFWPELQRLTNEISLGGKGSSSNRKSSAPVPVADRRFIVPVIQNSMFTGRTKILSKIKEFFSCEDYQGMGQKRMVLTGLGGVGKTQIATAFAYDTFSTTNFSTVFWMFANTREKVIQSLTDIAKKLGLATRPSPATSRAGTPAPQSQAVIDWLANIPNGDWLLVFDNVDDLEMFDVSEFFPKFPAGNIIITSRRRNAARFGEHIEVDMMDEADAVALLLRCSRLSVEHNKEKAKDVIDTLGGLPLAIDQAGAYIAEQNISLDDYMQLFSRNKAALLENKPPKAVWSYANTVYTTWEISYDKVDQMCPLATRLLDVSAFFSSDDIPLELLVNLAQELPAERELFLSSFLDGITTRDDYEPIVGKLPDHFVANEVEISQALGKLLSFSLIRRKANLNSFSIHPLVHSWLKDRHGANEYQQAELARSSISLVTRALFNASDLSRFIDAHLIFPHAINCISHLEEMPMLRNYVDTVRLAACAIAVQVWVPFSVDQGTLTKTDDFYEFVQKYSASIAAKSEKIPWQIPPTMLTMIRAYRFRSMAMHAEGSVLCEEYYSWHPLEEVSNKYEALYRACIAQIYGPFLFRQMKHDRAEQIYAISPSNNDPGQLMLARKEIVLGAIELDRCDFQKAEMFFKSCRDLLERGVGPGHFLWNVWHQLASLCYLAQGRHQLAEETVSLILQRRMKVLDGDKNAFMFSDWELAEVYTRVLRKQDRHGEALKYLDELLKKTFSITPRPSRALGELSLIMTRIEKYAIDLEKQQTRPMSSEDVEAMFEAAEEIFERAADAYEIEWMRGTWVFKFFQYSDGVDEPGGDLDNLRDRVRIAQQKAQTIFFASTPIIRPSPQSSLKKVDTNSTALKLIDSIDSGPFSIGRSSTLQATSTMGDVIGKAETRPALSVQLSSTLTANSAMEDGKEMQIANTANKKTRRRKRERITTFISRLGRGLRGAA